jgi:PAS domain S-box-containing protein
MLIPNPRDGSERSVLAGYGVAVVTVAAAFAALLLMETRWQTSAPVSLLLAAVIVTTWLAGTKPGVLATALAMLGFNYYYLGLSGLSGQAPMQAIRLLSFIALACYVVWITTSERAVAGSLRRAYDGLQQTNEALRVENMERRRTEEQLRLSEAKFCALTESAPAAIFIHHGDRISYANPAASSITGYSRAELCAMSFSDTGHPAFRGLLQARALARQKGELVPPRFELKIVTKAGQERWLDLTQGVFEFESTPAVVSIAFDITERKRAEEAVQESRQLLHQVLATLPVGVAVTDRAGNIVLANEASKRIWGGPIIISARERWARTIGYWHATGKRIAPAEWASARALSDGETTLNELIDIDSYISERKTIQNSTAPVRNVEGQIVGALIVNQDVTERVRVEEALHESANRLQHLSRRLLAVQEEERRHLSRELHDEFGQLLASISLHLHAARHAAGAAAYAAVDECMALLHHAGEQVRTLALELRPRMLETAGLDATLRWLAEQHQQRTGMATEVVGLLNDVPSELSIACFRVAQEALTNVARHACAQHVWIELDQSDGKLDLTIRDDGAGFDVTRAFEQAGSRGNLGLLGMRERVEILGGDLEVDSGAGRGTRIRISLPNTPAVCASGERAA